MTDIIDFAAYKANREAKSEAKTVKPEPSHTHPVPAYCDPSNERLGDKYEATKNLDVAEIAKLIRADIKALKLDKGIKTSVRIERFSGGRSIDIKITALPDSFHVLSPAYASWCKQFGYTKRFPGDHSETVSEECADLFAKLKAIHSSYNRDNSDAQSDYFDVHYYGNVTIDWRVHDIAKARDVEDARNDYWAKDA